MVMKFTEEVISKIETAMGFMLYPWQKHYLLNDFGLNHNYRCAGNTTIFAIKKLLTLKEVIDINSKDISKLCDFNPARSIGWFRNDLKIINDKLTSVGFITCLKVNEEPVLEITLEHALSKVEIKTNGQNFNCEGIDYISIVNGPVIVLKPDKFKLVPVEEERRPFW